MPVFGQEIQVHDFGTDPTDEVVFDIPTGHTLARATAIGLSWGTNDKFQATLGTGDSFDETGGDYIRSGWHHTFGQIVSSSSVLLTVDPPGSETGNGDPYNVFQFYNLNTAAPVVGHCFSGDPGSGRSVASWGIRTAAASRDQIKFKSVGGNNCTGGKLTLVTLKRRNTVESLAFDGEASHDITGLMKNNGGLCVWASFDAVKSNSSNTVGIRVGSGDPASYETASEYTQFEAGSDRDQVVVHSGFELDRATSANRFAFGVIVGAPEAEMFTGHVGGGTLNSGTPANYMGHWQTAEENDALQLVDLGGGTTFTGGTGYWVKYRV